MAVVATGFFDGVHIGHRKVIETLLECAARRSERSLVLTFWPHPRTVLQNDARSLRLLTTMEEKQSILLDMGVDEVAVIPFSKDFAALTAETYLEKVVKGRYGASAIVLGYDNRLGSDMLLPEKVVPVAGKLSLEAIVCPNVGNVSSTKIRAAVSEGDVTEASAMLGYPYMLHGVVVGGNRLGRTIGFPTANMKLYEPLKLVPGKGAYVTEVEVAGRTCYGMTNVDGAGKIETHIFNFSEDVYGLDIRLHFLDRIRHEMEFKSLDELKNQLCRDQEYCKKFIFEL